MYNCLNYTRYWSYLCVVSPELFNRSSSIRILGEAADFIMTSGFLFHDFQGILQELGNMGFYDFPHLDGGQQEDFLAVLFVNSPIAIYIAQQGKFVAVNPQFQRLTGYDPSELLSTPCLDLVVDEDRDRVHQNASQILNGSAINPYEFRIIDKSGRIRWVMESITRIKYDGRSAILGNFMDVSHRRQLNNQLLASNQKLLNIIEFLPDAIFVIDQEHKVIAWNRAMEELTGVKKAAMVGTSSYAMPFYGYSHEMLVDLLDQDYAASTPDNAIKSEGHSLYTEVYVPNVCQGRGAYIWAKASPLMDVRGLKVGAIESVRDISERKCSEDKLRYLGLHDSLTGIYNRTYFEEELHRLEATRFMPVGLILCDVDGLKIVNDTYGHGAGDDLLVATARVLKDCFRQSDVVARIGGDEFAILIANSDEASVRQSCLRIRETVNRYNAQQNDITLSISIGYAFRHDLGSSLGDTYREADNNMYQEKMRNYAMLRSTITGNKS